MSGAYPRYSASGAPSADWRNLRLADFTQFNAATYLDAGGAVDNGGALGWSIPVLGGAGKSVTDPFDGWHAISTNPITDLLGASLAVAKEWAAWVGLHEVSGVTASSDIDIVIGICNVATDGASNDWISQGFRLAATRTPLTSLGTNGAATQSVGSALTTIRRVRFPVIKFGTGTSDLFRPITTYQTAANAVVSGFNTTTSSAIWAGGLGGWADATPRLFIAAYRTSITDGTTRTPVYQPVHYPPLAMNLP